MKKVMLTAVLGTAAFGLAACDTSPDTVEDDTTIVTDDPMAMPPVEPVDPTLPDPAEPTDPTMGDDGTMTDTTTTDTTPN